ncbi:arylesterase [Ottowia sp.]|uniref:arylesterase n=1 Tax=Ottowia sp. TaxID=1898956 RepID=UPI002C7153A1|nr:arylesterase [Ottowia sp.]HOB65479.1 arylesterase [Ottowia sp.]HPZ57014.1 arylesterase [Ottowia sp.]HQD47424.1 arylesterase [Ottowia sp.]
MNRRHFIRSTLAATLPGPWAGATRAAGAPTLLVVGDSLSAEYGIARGSGWVALLEKKLAAEKIAAKVVNASVSGDTTAGGRARLPALLKAHQPAVVVIELGSNDALRGLSLDMTEANLLAMTQAAQAAGARVLLVGMQVPPNYGADHGRRFAELFAKVARSQRAALVPFLLKGVADRADPLALFQQDRIHPVAEAHPIILGNLWPEIQKLLKTP